MAKNSTSDKNGMPRAGPPATDSRPNSVFQAWLEFYKKQLQESCKRTILPDGEASPVSCQDRRKAN
jgi:hypothetical protein